MVCNLLNSPKLETNLKIIPLKQSEIQNYKKTISRHHHKKLLLFDIDNTLYTESNKMDLNIRDCIIQYGKQFLSHDESKKAMTFYYNKYGHTVKGYLKEYKEANTETWKQIYDQNLLIEKYLTKDDELKDILANLDGQKWCFTNGSYEIGLRMLRSLGLEDVFEGMICCEYDDDGEFMCKPDEDAYVFVEDLFDTRPEDIHVYEDRMINLYVPIKRGWNSYLVSVENNLKVILKKSNKQI